MYKGNRKLVWIVTGFSVVGLTFALGESEVFPQKIKAVYQDLPAEVAEAANRGREKLGHRVSNAVFEEISDLDILTASLGETGTLGLHASRAIFNNNDIEESFTVLDRLSLPVSFTALTLPLGSNLLTFNVGLGGALDVSNLRIVKPAGSSYTPHVLKDLIQGRDLAERVSIIGDSDWLGMAKSELAGPEPADEKKPLFVGDSLRKARYGKLWNMVAAPLRLPLRAEWLSKLEDNEVMTYSGSGTIEVGPSLGLNLEVSGARIGGLGLNASVRAYLNGQFRISVMRLAEKRAKLKVTRRVEKGIRGGVGTGSRVEVYDGFVLAGSTVGRVKTTLIPIAFSADRAFGKSFEVGYEYDLADERGIEAYEQAVLGQLALSDAIALATAAEGASAPVRRSFSRDAVDERRSRSINMRIVLIKHQGDGAYTVEDATIRFPDGTSKVFKARTDAVYSRKTGVGIWKSSEMVRYSIRTDFIEEAEGLGGQSSYGWIAEGRIEDNSSLGIELNRYSEMIESIFGNEGLFPQVPISIPAEDTENPVLQPTRYGYSSFYFRIGLTPEHLKRLAEVPAELRWRYLERAFGRPEGSWTGGPVNGVIMGATSWIFNAIHWATQSTDVEQRLGPKFLHAKDFHKHWSELAPFVAATDTLAGQKAFARKIGEMYSDKIFTFELIKVTMLALRDLQGPGGLGSSSEASFQINAQSAAFGRRDLRGGSITEIERITQRYANETDFDRPVLNQDLTLEVSGLSLEPSGDGKFRLKLSLSRVPSVVVIRLDELSDFLRLANPVRRLMIPNRGRFQAGSNEFVLDREAGPGFERELACAIRAGKSYRVTVALIDDERAGPASSAELFVNPATSGASKETCFGEKN